MSLIWMFLRKHDRGWGRRRMRYPASEQLEIIRIVEQSHLPAKRTLDQLGIPRRTFYRWYDRFVEGGPEALVDRPSAPSRVWNRIGDDIQDQIVEMALDYSELSPRELAVRFTDEKRYFVSEAVVYRLLKAHDLITSPAYGVIKAANQFHTKPPGRTRCGRPILPTVRLVPDGPGDVCWNEKRKEELNECLALCCEGA
ncbi:Homeodomain-like domain-containing protein [Sphingobium sp. YR768]|nr:Homeodomain-like domain-containing protein [Sphingobium sp. YR768]